MRLRVLFGLMALTIAPMAFAGTYTLSDWCFYVNSLDLNQSCNAGSSLSNVPTAAPGVTDLLQLQNDGTGTLTVTLAPGQYNIFGIFNYNVDGNGLNEYATALGSLSVGQVYSINVEGSGGTSDTLSNQGLNGTLSDQGLNGTLSNQGLNGTLSNQGLNGTLYNQGLNGTLNDTNACPNLGNCTDVAVALGYTNVTVPDGSTGRITFTAGTTPPPSGFSVTQTNGNTGGSITLSSDIQIDDNLATLIGGAPAPNGFSGTQSNGNTGGSLNLSSNIQINGNLTTLIAPVPEPGAMGLMGAGLGALLCFARRKRRG
jgi:hypothetical protein